MGGAGTPVAPSPESLRPFQESGLEGLASKELFYYFQEWVVPGTYCLADCRGSVVCVNGSLYNYLFAGLSLHQTVGARGAVTLAPTQYYQGEPNLTLWSYWPQSSVLPLSIRELVLLASDSHGQVWL